MDKPSASKIGLLVALLFGGWHVCWSFLVLVGWAQPILDFIFWAHMIRPVYIVNAFDPLAAVMLILITTVLGFALGYVGAVVWSKVRQNR